MPSNFDHHSNQLVQGLIAETRRLIAEQQAIGAEHTEITSKMCNIYNLAMNPQVQPMMELRTQELERLHERLAQWDVRQARFKADTARLGRRKVLVDRMADNIPRRNVHQG